MSLRIAFDLDGTLADFEHAYRQVEERLFGAGAVEPDAPRPETLAEAEEAARAAGGDPPEGAGLRRPPGHRDLVWREIQGTTDFWLSLDPLDPAAVARLYEMATRYRWEVMFITQRPKTAGETVQRQTQRWLVRQGFELPSVMVLRGSRGKVADALHLDCVVDDSTQNCVDVISESAARAMLVLPSAEREKDPHTQRARQLGIGVVPSIGACLDLLDEMESKRSNPSLLQRMARLVGLKSAPF
jgi:hypothetical protein